jgi:hypothetical protein
LLPRAAPASRNDRDESPLPRNQHGCADVHARRGIVRPRRRGCTRSACSSDRNRGNRRRVQIQLWNSIRRLNVCIEVPTNAAEMGSIAAKPAPATTS